MPASAASVSRMLLRPKARAFSAMRACGTNTGVFFCRKAALGIEQIDQVAQAFAARHGERIELPARQAASSGTRPCEGPERR